MASKKVKADTKKGKSARKVADTPTAERAAKKDQSPSGKVDGGKTAKSVVVPPAKAPAVMPSPAPAAKAVPAVTPPPAARPASAPPPTASKAQPVPVVAKPAPAAAPAPTAKATPAPSPAPAAAKPAPAPAAAAKPLAQPAVAAKPLVPPAVKPVAQPASAAKPAPAPEVNPAGSLGAQPAPEVNPVHFPAATSVTSPSFESLVSKLSREISDGQEKLRREVDALRQEFKKSTTPPKERDDLPASLEEDLDKASRTFKRTLVDLVERNTERLCFPLATLERQLEQLKTRSQQEAPEMTEALAHCVSGLTAVLEELGVERFDAELQEVFDPMIHQAIGEKNHENVEHGRVVEAVAPGFRSSTGRILLPAQVLVNRR